MKEPAAMNPIQTFDLEVVYHTYNTYKKKILARDIETASEIAKEMFLQDHTKECHFDNVRQVEHD